MTSTADPNFYLSRQTDLLEQLLRSNKSNGLGITGSFTDSKNAIIAGLVGVAKGSNELERSFEGLSKSGTSFNQDIVRMSQAVAQSRMDFSQFSYFMQDHGKSLSGLGGTVTSGAEKFSTLMDQFHQESKSLRYLSYTTKEMNELLAYTVATSRVVNMNDEAQRKLTTDSARRLGEEFDKLNKLTGLSKEEMMKELENRKRDAAFNAKMEMLRRTMAPEEFLAYKKNIDVNLAMASAVGASEAYMETFTKGYISSETAAMQAQIVDNNVITSALLAGKGQLEQSSKVMEEGFKRTMERTNTNEFLNMAMISGDMGEFGQVIGKTASSVSTLQNSINAIAATHGRTIATEDDFREAIAKATQEQTGQNEAGKQVDDMHRAAVDVSMGFQGLNVATYKAAEEIRIFGKSARDFADSIARQISDIVPDNAEKSLTELISNLNEKVTSAFGTEFSPENLKQGLSTITSDVGSGFKTIVVDSGTEFAKSVNTAAGYLTGLENRASLNNTSVVQQALDDALNAIAPHKSTGSLGTTGSLIEHFNPTGSLIFADGDESIATPEHLTNLASGSMQTGIQQGIKTSIGMLSAIAEQSNIDLSPMMDEYQKHADDINKQLGTIVTTIQPVNNTDDSDINGLQTLNDIFNKITYSFSNINQSNMDMSNAINGTQQSLKMNIDSAGNISKTTATGLLDIQNVLQKQVDSVNVSQHSSNINTPNQPVVDLNSFNLSKVAPGLNNTPPAQAQPSAAPKPVDNKQEAQKSTAAAEEHNKMLNSQNNILVQVLTQLKTLNEQFSTFMHQHETIGNKQVKATQNVGPNLFPQ